ncbi:tetratricopeptide repeat protein [Labilibaculum sp. DW002]|uniref:Tetratricopeptide repeat protein n=1 Tax=Paralabilibaculum antarcticum TaxID=2912572 RepID=A0ABT5VMS5_9BACT|nr:tetratricopeptide repeat protein [Labilibaculum sp. DW002]MDE5416738.1 tetratricopeptide repeat protein [Labilibaculum sp. DW002]
MGEDRNVIYDKIIDYYYENDTSKILSIINKAESKAVKNQNKETIYKYRYKRAKYYSFIENHTKAISEFSSLLNLDLSITKRAKIYGKIGREYEKLYEYSIAVEYLEKSNEHYKLSKSISKIALNKIRIASIYKTICNYSMAVEYALASLTLLEQNEGSDKDLARVYNTLGSVYKYQKHYKKALAYYIKSLDIYKKNDNTRSIASSYNYIGIIYNNLEEYDIALDYYMKSVEIKKNYAASRTSLSTQYNNIAMVYAKINQFDKAHAYIQKSLSLLDENKDSKEFCSKYNTLAFIYYRNKEYGSAEYYYKKALDLSKQLGILIDINSNYHYLYKIAEQNGKHKKALDYFKLYKETSDSLFNISQARRIVNIESSYKVDKQLKDREIALQKARNSNVMMLSSLLISIVVLVFLLVLISMRNKKNKLRQEKMNLEKHILEENLICQKKELTSTMISLREKSNFMDEVASEFKSALNLSPNKREKAVRDVVKNIELNKNNSIFDELDYRFEQLNSDFFKSLTATFPNLTNNERKLIAFLKLDLNTKEISFITKQTPHSINVARTRLRKKLGIANKDISFAEFFNDFSKS